MVRSVALIVLVACTRDRSQPPAPPSSPPARRAVTQRAKLDHLNHIDDVPRHGALVLESGLGANGPVETRVVLDADALTITADNGPIGAPVTVTKLAAADRDRLVTLGALAWAAPPPTLPDVTDRLEILVVADGDDTFVVRGAGELPAGPAGDLRDALMRAAGFGAP